MCFLSPPTVTVLGIFLSIEQWRQPPSMRWKRGRAAGNLVGLGFS